MKREDLNQKFFINGSIKNCLYDLFELKNFKVRYKEY